MVCKTRKVRIGKKIGSKTVKIGGHKRTPPKKIKCK